MPFDLGQQVRVANARRPAGVPAITLEHWVRQGWSIDAADRRIGGRYRTRRETAAFLDGLTEAFELVEDARRRQ